jgi:short subunit dehydrogenase-like uncharacterized protein
MMPRVASKMPNKVPTSTAVKRKSKKPDTTPKRKNKAVEPQYIEVKIRVPYGDYQRGMPYFEARENLNKFTVEALREKINRAEANDKAGRRKKLLTDEYLLLEVLKDMQGTGKLKFLFPQKDK